MKEACLDNILNHVEGLAGSYLPPFVLILEFGHFSAESVSDLVWATKNALFAEQICSTLVKRFRRDIRVVPYIIVNDLGSSHFEISDLPPELLAANRFLTLDKTHIMSERNLRNIATRRLKKVMKDNPERLQKSFDRLLPENPPVIIVDNAVLNVCPAVANIILESGRIIPRCGAIMAAFVENAMKLSNNRLSWKHYKDVVLLSFVKNEHEKWQTILGINVYLNNWPRFSSLRSLDSIFILWQPEGDCDITLIRWLEAK